MRTGTICYATDTGLGVLAKSFIDHGVIDEILVWENSRYPEHREWYPNACRNEEELLSKVDRLMFFETPFNWSVILRARERGIKTILMAMHECTTFPFPYEPDVLIGGSLLEVEHYKKYGKKCIHINPPVEEKWRLRERAMVFVHNAGHGGLGGRNSTQEVLDAMKYVKSPIKLIVRTQNGGYTSDDPRVEIREGTVSHEELYKEGDVFLFPEKFNGNSLPLQEAFASGMLVMCGDRFPMNTWLPMEPMIQVKSYKKLKIGAEFWSALYDPEEIAKTIDKWYGKNISKFSLMGRKWAKENSWEKLKPLYDVL